jgi:hypothetical protein
MDEQYLEATDVLSALDRGLPAFTRLMVTCAST